VVDSESDGSDNEEQGSGWNTNWSQCRVADDWTDNQLHCQVIVGHNC